MDFSKATNKELFKIAFDENRRLKDRYAAAREIQRRMKKDEIHRY